MIRPNFREKNMSYRTMRLFVVLALSAIAAVSLAGSPPQGESNSFDVLIRNAHVIDGTGSPWYEADVGIRGGRIAAIGRLRDASATKEIDARGRVVAPGFIDMLGQSDLTILVDPRLPSKIYQGITTEVTGEGSSVAPLNDAIMRADRLAYVHFKVTPDWRTLGQYFARLERQSIGINVADYVGATQVRRMVIGDADRAPTSSELDQMRALVKQAMQEGAVGVSTSLQYAPAPYAKTDELIALASEAARFGGIYATHIRNEGDNEMAALAEAVRIGREAKIPVEIWHLKSAGKPNWGKMPQVVEFIQHARDEGVDISANTYAYPAWLNSLSAFVPPWAHDGGDAKMIERLRDPAMRQRIKQDMRTPSKEWDNEWQEIPGPESILISAVQNEKLLPLQGKTIAQIATDRHADPMDTIFDILIEDAGYTYASVFAMDEHDVALALKQPWTSICNDSQGTSPEGILGKEHPHPRAYGTFPRILKKYVREENLVTLSDAIRKFSALPAQKMGFTDRGVLKAGMWADIVVFDPQTIHDVATFEKPNQLSEGMEYVLVNGVPVIEEGRMTGAHPGTVLRGPGYRH
ncbi:MAG TPA: D-aminoacylase [Candidatus Acidoferrales bacterium]|nr:D-aminoacylase [Candidatus Acidoferrales bacterium]